MIFPPRSEVDKIESEFTERGFQPGTRFVSFVRDVRASGRGEAACAQGVSFLNAGGAAANIDSGMDLKLAAFTAIRMDFKYF